MEFCKYCGGELTPEESPAGEHLECEIQATDRGADELA